MKKLLYISVLLLCISINGQQHSHKSSRALSFPDIPGYKTLKTDLHIHSVFSDGSVWPDIRVQEALRDNLDVISLTEHLEYQPHIKDIPHPDRNRAYDLALEEAKNHDLLIINGSEITRSAPTGHNNAVFISDANKLMQKDSVKQFAAAKKQGAFVFWNHPNWAWQSPTGNPIWTDFQKERVKKHELHGIEVINEGLYDKESFGIALKHDLTIMGTSDVHGLIDWDYIEKGHTRPVTLVFAEENTKESIKEALFEGRTVAVFNELFVGKSEYLKPLLKACLSVEKASYMGETQILEVTVKNISSNKLLFKNEMDFTFYGIPPIVEIEAGKTKILKIKTLQILSTMSLKLKALGGYIAPEEHPIIVWEFDVTN
jgi:hypothetical protein